jgi:SHS family lactate transporter-like MFS transporter
MASRPRHLQRLQLARYAKRRRRTIVVAALGALVVIPFWAYASGIFWIGLTAFLMQFAVQAAYGIVPAHLNEISPDAVRSTFPGVTSQIGNLLAAGTATLQSSIADHAGGHNFSLPFAITASTGAVAVALLVWLGRDASDVDFGGNLAASVGPDVKSHPLTIKESAAS